MSEEPAPNALGLEFAQAAEQEIKSPVEEAETPLNAETPQKRDRIKKDAYVNPDRVNTGGLQRVKCIFTVMKHITDYFSRKNSLTKNL